MRPAERPARNRRGGERGAALLTVLLLVAVIAVIAGTALEKLRLTTRLAGNARDTEQARAYAYAAETLALTRVNDLLGRDASRVTLVGGWSGRPIPLPVPHGIATARVSDGGNCFNLNGLVVRAEGGYGAFPPAMIQFVRLMKLVGVPAQAAAPIAAATADWIDSDTSPLEQGAEDSAYRGAATPYRTANTLMTDVSELRAVAGVTPDIYAKLRPWLCALPVAAPAVINIDTLLPEQAPLFAMLLPDTLGVEGARQMLLRRPPQGYDSADKFWAVPAQAAVKTTDAVGQTAVTTHWFTLDIDVSLGGAEIEQRSLIDATRLPGRLVSRQWGEPS